MGARRRRINKERLGIFGLYAGSADEESGGDARRRASAPSVIDPRSPRDVPWAVWVAWGAVALVGFFLFRFQHLLG